MRAGLLITARPNRGEYVTLRCMDDIDEVAR